MIHPRRWAARECLLLGAEGAPRSHGSHFSKGVSPFTKGLFICSHLFSKHVQAPTLCQVTGRNVHPTITKTELPTVAGHRSTGPGTLVGLHPASQSTQTRPFSRPSSATLAWSSHHPHLHSHHLAGLLVPTWTPQSIQKTSPLPSP